MAKQLYKYTFDDLKDQDNNCIVTSLTQLSEKCNIPYRTLQSIFSKRNIHYEKNGNFKIEKRIHFVDKSKIRL
jgi:hypothetical protein